MMKFTLLFLVVFFSLFFFSCKKQALSYKIEGTITNKISNQFISKTTVKLYKKVYSKNVLSNNYTLAGETNTNSTGQYAFEIPREKLFEIKLEFLNENYYPETRIYSSEYLNSEDINYFNEALEAKSWLAIILKNPFISPEEQLNLNKQNFKEGCEACCTNGNQSFYETGDTTIVCATVGGEDIKLFYGEATTNTSFSKIINCIPFDTTYFEIKY